MFVNNLVNKLRLLYRIIQSAFAKKSDLKDNLETDDKTQTIRKVFVKEQ